ncbi:MAG: hypothetical protein CFH44_00168 [Proteobacteria bacterium]|nr:MAG: hypothetical protein CFH44_00168 [Pseudomonadota bacterium]
MLKLSKLKVLLVVVLAFVSLNANSAEKSFVEVSTKDNTLLFTTKENIKNAVFTRFNDVWVVFSKKKLNPNFDMQVLSKFGVKEVEKLMLQNGEGYRFRFAEKAPIIKFDRNYENRTVSIILDPLAKPEKTPDRIKFRVKTHEENPAIKELFLDSTYMLDYAYSFKTGEKYIVAISSDSRLNYPTKEIYEDLLFLPAASGAVIISQKGEFVRITDEEQIELSDVEDNFFAKAAASYTNHSLNEFLRQNGIALLERQLRDYSIFNRQIESFKSEGNYDDVIKRINDAIDKAANVDFLVGKEITTNPKKVESAVIIEGSVIDQSGEDDGLFEMEKNADKEFKDIEKEDVDVLVPEFELKKIKFQKEKLRLSSIKNTSLYQKEKITIKRMQIAAFSKYYPEILDLTTLMRLDISGEFPKNNKALALYTLANAKMNRCSKIINLPEIDGSVYTQDIRLWKAYCLAYEGKYETALGLFKSNFKRVSTYPQNLEDELKLAYSKALTGLDNYDMAIGMLKKLEERANEYLLPEIKYNLGIAYLYQNESDLALKKFKELLFSENLDYRFKARLEFLNLELYDKNVDKMQIIAALEDLRFDYRSNETELSASKLLASLYLQEDYLKEAMELYKYISIYFPQTESAKYATETLFNIFYNLFAKKQKTNSNLGLVERLALFYDFIELTPSEYEGNQIISNIVDELMALGLNNNAIKLLTIQLNYKTKDADIAQILGEKLSKLYLNDGQVKNAFKTLVLTQKETLDKNYTPEGKLIKANILLTMGKDNDAIELLNTLENNIESSYILADIYWNKNNYKKIISTLESIFLGKKVVLDERAIVNLSYLMVAYALTENVEKLRQVKDLYINELSKVDLEYKVEFLLKLAGDDIKVTKKDNQLLDVWQKVIDIDNSVLDFVNDYNKEVDFREALKKRDYNALSTKYSDRLN